MRVYEVYRFYRVYRVYEAGNARRASQLAKTAGKKRKAGDMEQETWDCKLLGQAAGSGNEFEAIIRNLQRLGRCLSVPITRIQVPYFGRGPVDHPIISLEDFIRFMLPNHSEKLLGGYKVGSVESQLLLSQFWSRYRRMDPSHVVFEDFTSLSHVVPLVLYGDEGTGVRKHPVWILAWKPVLFCHTSSWWRSYLYTVAPHEVYSGYKGGTSMGNACLDAMVGNFVSEAQKLYHQGCLPWWKNSYHAKAHLVF